MIWGFIFCFLIFIRGYQRFGLLNSRADVIKLSKVVTSQKVCAVHTQTGEGVKQPCDILKNTRRWRCCCFPSLTIGTQQVAAA